MAYDTWVESLQGDSSHRAVGIHASELKCVRKVVYTLLDTPKKSRMRKVWRQRMEQGKAVHTMLQRDFKKMAEASNGLMEFQEEVAISPHLKSVAEELSIYSSADGVFTFREVKGGPITLRVGLEIKTESPDAYAKLIAPRPDHIEQAHVYMKCLDLPLMWFLYFNKGNQNNTTSSHPFLITFDEKIWEGIAKRCNLSLSFADAYPHTKELPGREEGVHCEFCSYSWACKPNYLEKRNAPRWAPIPGVGV